MVERPAAPPPRVLGAPPRGGWLLGLSGDVRDGARALRGEPGLTVVALLTLAVGIGANVAIFSVVNAVLLRPLPFARSRSPRRLLGIGAEDGAAGRGNWPDAVYVHFRNRGRVLRPVAAYGEFRFTITNGTGEAERIRGAAVTANFFETLGRSPIRGRAFTSAEEGPRNEHVAILGYGLWQRRYGADPKIVGQTIQAGGRPGDDRRGDAAGLRLPEPRRGVAPARDRADVDRLLVLPRDRPPRARRHARGGRPRDRVADRWLLARAEGTACARPEGEGSRGDRDRPAARPYSSSATSAARC